MQFYPAKTSTIRIRLRIRTKIWKQIRYQQYPSVCIRTVYNPIWRASLVIWHFCLNWVTIPIPVWCCQQIAKLPSPNSNSPILPHLPIPIHQFRPQPSSNSPIPPPNSYSSIAVTNPSKQGLMYLPTASVRSTAISIFTWEIYYFSNFTWKISTWWTGITGEHSLERIKAL